MFESIPGITTHARLRARRRGRLSAAALIALWRVARPAAPQDFERFHTTNAPECTYRVGVKSWRVFMLVADGDTLSLITLIPKRNNPDGR